MPVPANEIKFSLLILSIPSRVEAMGSTIKRLQTQAEATGQARAVEILVLLDNYSKTISEKRNDLLKIARGSYVAFLDDDDMVSERYLERVLDAIDAHSGVDCISFNQWCSLNGELLSVEFGIGNPHGELWRMPDGQFGPIKRPPYHMCAWRRELAQSEAFNSVYASNGQSTEDINWLMRLYPKVQTEHHIDAALHGYIYDSRQTASLVRPDPQ